MVFNDGKVFVLPAESRLSIDNFIKNNAVKKITNYHEAYSKVTQRVIDAMKSIYFTFYSMHNIVISQKAEHEFFILTEYVYLEPREIALINKIAKDIFYDEVEIYVKESNDSDEIHCKKCESYLHPELFIKTERSKCMIKCTADLSRDNILLPQYVTVDGCSESSIRRLELTLNHINSSY